MGLNDHGIVEATSGLRVYAARCSNLDEAVRLIDKSLHNRTEGRTVIAELDEKEACRLLREIGTHRLIINPEGV